MKSNVEQESVNKSSTEAVGRKRGKIPNSCRKEEKSKKNEREDKTKRKNQKLTKALNPEKRREEQKKLPHPGETCEEVVIGCIVKCTRNVGAEEIMENYHEISRIKTQI